MKIFKKTLKIVVDFNLPTFLLKKKKYGLMKMFFFLIKIWVNDNLKNTLNIIILRERLFKINPIYTLHVAYNLS